MDFGHRRRHTWSSTQELCSARTAALQRRSIMDFAVLFLVATAALLAAWRTSRLMAVILFGAALLGSTATLLHHATDALKLSF